MSLDLDQEEEEDIRDELSDDEDEDSSNDDHQRARHDDVRVLVAQVGKIVNRLNAQREGIVWIVVTSIGNANAASTSSLSSSVVHPNASPERSTMAGLVGGLLAITTGEVDILSLWLRLYLGDMRQHLAEMNADGLRSDHRFKVISEFEWVRF